MAKNADLKGKNDDSDCKQTKVKTIDNVTKFSLVCDGLGEIAEGENTVISANKILSGWADISSEGTWDLFVDSNFGSSATALASTVDAMNVSSDEEVNEILDAPRFEYGKVVAYAREMGLPTNFPL